MKFLLVCLLLFSQVWAQFNSDWQTITNLNEIKGLVASPDKIWAATTGGLFSRDLTSGQTDIFTNTEGLKSVRLNAIERDSGENIIVGGDNGVLEIYNVSEKSWKQIYTLQDYSISDIHSRYDTLWVSNAKGLAVFQWDGLGYAFIDYFSNFKVFPQEYTCVQYFAGYIWLGTDIGLLMAPADFGRHNITNPEVWRVLRTGDGLPANNIQNLAVISGQLWVLTSSGMARIDTSLNISIFEQWYKDANQNFVGVNFAAEAGSHIYVGSGRTLYIYDPSYGFSGVKQYEVNLSGMTGDASGRLWIGFVGDGLLNDQDNLFIKIDGPASNSFRTVFRDSRGWIWASASKPKHTQPIGFYLNKGSGWLQYDFAGTNWADLHSNVGFYEDRFGTVWCPTWGGGLFALTADEQLIFFHNFTSDGTMYIHSRDTTEAVPMNSTTATILTDYFSGVVILPTYEVITAVKEDYNGYLWVANYWAKNDHLLAAIPYGQNNFPNLDINAWTYFGSVDGIIADEGGIICMEIDQANRVWIGTMNNGVFVLDHNNTLQDKSDDLIFQLQINDNLYSNRVYSIATDLDGVVWIGTAGGLNSFDGVNVYKHVGDNLGKAGPLENQISQIKVDKFNNKWFATSGGLSILRSGRSPWDAMAWEGYTTENSSLVDNEVHAIFIDDKNGSAYIGTEKGLAVYRGTFAEIRDNYDETIGGPNPFITGTGSRVFTLKNLMLNSVVKIFNLNGSLIRELGAQETIYDGSAAQDGSRAYWDGLDSFGKPVASGIYLFMAYDVSGSATAGKVAVIRK